VRRYLAKQGCPEPVSHVVPPSRGGGAARAGHPLGAPSRSVSRPGRACDPEPR